MNLLNMLGLLLVGAAAGYFYSEINKQKANSTMVMVPMGTEFGARLDHNPADAASREHSAARVDYSIMP